MVVVKVVDCLDIRVLEERSSNLKIVSNVTVTLVS